MCDSVCAKTNKNVCNVEWMGVGICDNVGIWLLDYICSKSHQACHGFQVIQIKCYVSTYDHIMVDV